MQTNATFLIWDKIVISAKKRLDLSVYHDKLQHLPAAMLDTMILHIIVAFASGEDHHSIAINLHNELQHVGIAVSEDTIDSIIADKHVVFSAEIYAAYLAFSMLEDGHREQEILGYVTELLESPRIM